MQTRVMTAHVPLPLADKVDELAERLDRSRGWIIKQALADWIADEEERYQLTLEGLADIDAGRVVDHDIVQTWIKSLSTANPLPDPPGRDQRWLDVSHQHTHTQIRPLSTDRPT